MQMTYVNVMFHDRACLRGDLVQLTVVAMVTMHVWKWQQLQAENSFSFPQQQMLLSFCGRPKMIQSKLNKIDWQECIIKNRNH